MSPVYCVSLLVKSFGGRSYRRLCADIDTADEEQDGNGHEPGRRKGPVGGSPGVEVREQGVVLGGEDFVEAPGGEGDDDPVDEEGGAGDGDEPAEGGGAAG